MEEHNTQPAAPTSTLPAVGQLLRESWEFTKGRLDLVGWYVLISLVPLVLVALPVGLGVWAAASAPQLLWAAVVAGLVALLVMIWVMVVASAGLFYAVAQEERIRFIEGWRWARPRFWQIAWIGVLLMLVLTTAFMALFLPAFIIMVYTMFYFLSFLRHDHRGLNALAASTNVVYGRFWGVLGRLAFMMLIIIVVSLAITVIFEILAGIIPVAENALVATGELINTVVSFVLTIVMMRYLVLLYTAADATTPAYQAEPLSTSYKLYRVLAWVGGVVFVAMSLGGAVLLGTWASEGFALPADEAELEQWFEELEDAG
ncbi:hypothetical protein CL655_03055 [bacterium]|nr:hypothetical protein [bacterium]|tara:strand:+ start:2768 stop:3715 length:948 start_codon:yes stop_codon:yes gene_type:complete